LLRTGPWLEPVFNAPSETSDEDPPEDDREGDGSGRVEPVALNRVGRSFAPVVRDQSDRRRPDDPAGGVPEQELPPVHPREAGDPGDGVAEDGDEATEEDRLAAVARHQRLGPRKNAVGVAVQPAPAAKEGPAAEPPDQPVAEVVADDRAGRRNGDHRLDAVVPL